MATNIRLNLQHTFIVEFRVLSLLCVHWYYGNARSAGRILVHSRPNRDT